MVGAYLKPSSGRGQKPIHSILSIVAYSSLERDVNNYYSIIRGDEKTALFIVIPDTNKTLNFLIAIMYQQLFDTLCRHADIDCKGTLPYHVRFLLDEFANIGIIPNFEIYMATARSRGISFNLSLQTLAQLKSIYDKKTEIITGNADSLLFLGGNEESTLKIFSEAIGKTTVNVESLSYSTGIHGSVSKGNQTVARDLIAPNEIGNMSRSECILLISNLPPFKSKKYDIEKHPRYKKLSDYDPRNYYEYKRKKLMQQRETPQELSKR